MLHLDPVRRRLVGAAGVRAKSWRSSLTHARRMDGFCNQNADQLGYLAGPLFHDSLSFDLTYV